MHGLHVTSAVILPKCDEEDLLHEARMMRDAQINDNKKRGDSK